MSTWKDFENAPVGATATNQDGSVRVWKETETDDLPWAYPTYTEWFSNGELVSGGYTLNPTAPTNSREALDLAWELAHEVKEGQIVPIGTRYFSRAGVGDLATFTASVDWTPSPRNVENFRTLDPLPDPEPEPDWLNAPAVMARLEGFSYRRTWVPVEDGYWASVEDGHTHWSALTDVTPLWPKEEA